jgi:hypothetical protein
MLLGTSPAQSFLGPSPFGLVTIFYCFRFETALSSPPTIRRITVEVFTRVTMSCTESVNLSLMLRSTVSRPVCLVVKHPSEAYDRIFISVRQLAGLLTWALSLTWWRVCRLELLLVLASAVIFYCLKFETSLFVASYDSQGYCGGIRPSIHTWVSCTLVSHPLKKFFADWLESTILKGCVSVHENLRWVGNVHIGLFGNNSLPMSLQWERLCPLPRKWRFHIESSDPAFRHSETVVHVVITYALSRNGRPRWLSYSGF